MTALHQLLRNQNAESLSSMRQAAISDPEGRFYAARHLAHLGDRDGALELLERVVKDGFFCLPALTRDPWLDSLRGFLTAEGDRVLGIAHPV